MDTGQELLKGNGKGDVLYNPIDLTSADTLHIGEKLLYRDTPAKTGGVLEKYSGAILATGEPVFKPSSHIEAILQLFEKASSIIKDVIELSDSDEIECINQFMLFEEQLKLLWDKREYLNENLTDVIVHLLTAAKNSRYQTYNNKQYTAFSLVIEQVKIISINKSDVRKSLLILRQHNIDLFSAIRNWENYSIELRKKE